LKFGEIFLDTKGICSAISDVSCVLIGCSLFFKDPKSVKCQPQKTKIQNLSIFLMETGRISASLEGFQQLSRWIAWRVMRVQNLRKFIQRSGARRT